MNQDKIKRMFGSKRSLSLSDSSVIDPKIVIPASSDYNTEMSAHNEAQNKKFYTEQELTAVQGSWDFKKSTPVLEASLTDYLAQERMHSRQPDVLTSSPSAPKKTSMSLNDLKSQTGVYHDYALSNHFDYTPAIEVTEPHYQENSTGEEVPYNMSYLPEETQALPGTKGFFLFAGLMKKVVHVSAVLLVLPFIALAGLYFVQGPEGEQWVQVKGHVQKLVQYAQGSRKTLFPSSQNQTDLANNTQPSNQATIGQNSQEGKKNAAYRPAGTPKSNLHLKQARRFGIGGQVISGAQTDRDIPLMITVPSHQKQSEIHVKISGLPNNAILTKGHYMAAGVWMVPITDIDNIAMRISGNLHRDVELQASYLQEDGKVVELASYKIPQNFQQTASNAPVLPEGQQDIISAKVDDHAAGLDNRTRHTNLASRNSAKTIPQTHLGSGTKNQPLKNRPKQNKAQNKTVPLRIHPVYEQQQLNRASIYLAKSDFTTARSILKKTAEAGSARAATALARSYDPKFLLKIKVRGIKPNLDQAKYWYQQAVKLGNASALNRLSQLK